VKKIFVIAFVLLTSVLAGCAAPKYTATAIANDYESGDVQVVIINDEKTREGFQKTMESWLDKHNFNYTTSSDGSKHDLEKLTLEYEGHWGWDLALYMNDAYIEAFQNGQRVGKVEFKAPNSLNGNKFGNAEERIGYMMSVLFGRMTEENATKTINSSN
tara:strand:+ start:205 stop:681 length:477 start_codon:yes stop_codon:yes gene_type:complete